MKKNFTLIELIVSIVVIGILAAIVMLNISDLRLQAEETAYAANSREIQTAVDRYKLEYGSYPTTPQPTKDNPQVVEMDKIIPEFLRSEPKGKYEVEVDDKGNSTLIVDGKVIEDDSSGGNVGTPTVGASPAPPIVAIGCEEAESQGYICIYTPEELNDIRNNISGKYILMNDIDLTSFSPWTPIGTSVAGFSGELNGNGFKITNLNMDQSVSNAAGYTPTNYGFFGEVHSGTFKNLSISNYKLSVTDSVSAAGLIGYVNSTPTTNPTGKPVVIENVKMSGDTVHGGTNAGTVSSLIGYVYSVNADLTVKHVSFTGKILSTSTYNYRNSVTGLIGMLDVMNTPEGRQMNVNISNISLTDIDLNGYGVVAGLFNEINLDYTDAIVNIVGITITGKMESADEVSGIASQVNADYATYEYNISDVNMNAALHSRGTDSWSVTSGLMANLYANEASGSTTVENSVISGPLTMANPNSRRGHGITGLIDYHNTWDSTETLIIRNVDITSPMTGDNLTIIAGLISNYNPNYAVLPNKTIHSFTNINISSDMNGGLVSGLIDNFNAYGLNLDLTVSDIMFSGDMNGVFVSGLINNYNSGNSVIKQNISNIVVNSNIIGTTEASGLINTFNPFGRNDADDLTLNFSGIKVNGNITGGEVAGVMYGFWPDNGLLKMNFNNIEVNGILTGTNVAGFANTFEPNNTRNQMSSNTFLLDGFKFTGEMNGVDSVAGLFGVFNFDDRNYAYYTGLYGASNYTIQNTSLDGKTTVSNGETGKHGDLIGKLHTELRGNTYLFKDVILSNETVITGENTATFKKGIVADFPAIGYDELIFDNVQ